ncbi:MAG: helix-turn-helix domain-containing protein [Treponema sp.]|jgi:transcriptional regulator with XRE-family HTH domain|nr:helix-turn-helix domain-containing protein [Treponema sp.]
MTFQELFIINLKELRKNNKISQAKLANLCGSTQAYIAEIEVGKKFPSPDMIERIASALNIESYCLFQNKVFSDNKLLTPLQRREMAELIYAAAAKIIEQY